MIDDITEQVHSEEKLKAAMEESDAANKAKNRFLANVSHEIRTPMNVIIGITELLLDTGLRAEQKEYASIVKDSADYLLTIVNDILDFSKLEADRLELTNALFNLPAELKKTVGSFAYIAEKKGLGINYAPGSALPEYVIGDPIRVNQVLTNLIGNALKYTFEGRVGISVDLIDGIPGIPEGGESDFIDSAEEERCFICFRVSDTGIGIPSEKQHLLFQSFTQLEQAKMPKQDGTGLGLVIAKTLVELMGGKIWFESEFRRGSELAFVLPFALPTEDEVERFKVQDLGGAPEGSWESLHLLLVEDKPLNRKLAGAFLEKMGHSVVTAANGREAVEMIAEGGYDAVLMDINMPEMDGIEATKVIRARERRASRETVPIIAMTAYAMKGDREKCLEAGMDGYISKPFKSEELQNIITRTVAKYRTKHEREPGLLAPSSATAGTIPPDMAAMLEKVDGNCALLDELVGLLLADYHQEIASFGLALAGKEVERAASIMHGLKGQFGSLGLEGAFELAKDIEAMLKKQDMIGVPSSLILLREEVARLEAFFADPLWLDKLTG